MPLAETKQGQFYKMSDLNPKLVGDMTEVFGQYGWREIPYYKTGEKKMSEEIVEVEVESSEIVETQPSALTTNIFGTTNPQDFIVKSQEYAKALVQVVDDQELYANIKGKKYVTFEGWQFLGSMLPTAITPQTEWTVELKDENTGETTGYKTRVVAKDINGNERGAAESVCMYAEPTWSKQPANALMSMAQTRASSKALRMALSSIVKLAGFESTPKEEMEAVEVSNIISSDKNNDKPIVNSGQPSPEQLKYVKDLIRKNVDHDIVKDEKYYPLLVRIGQDDITKTEVSSVLDWLQGKTDSLVGVKV